MAIRADDLTAAVSAILDDYAEDVQEAVAQAVEATGKKTLRSVKAKSPVLSGRYKKGWRMKKERGGVFGTQAHVTIHNKEYRLIHLLEDGHQKAGGGRVAGIPHVQPAYEEAARLLPELTARAIEEVGDR